MIRALLRGRHGFGNLILSDCGTHYRLERITYGGTTYQLLGVAANEELAIEMWDRARARVEAGKKRSVPSGLT